VPLGNNLKLETYTGYFEVDDEELKTVKRS